MKNIIIKLTRPFRARLRECKLSNAFDFMQIAEKLAFIKNKSNGVVYCFPYPSLKMTERRQLNILKNGFHKHLLEKYTEPGFQIEQSDTVIDCGAFVGGFSVAAWKAGAARVISVEPSSKNRNCLRVNLAAQGCEHAVIEPVGLGEAPGSASLNLSESGCDDSLLDPDADATGEVEEVAIETIESLVQNHSIDDNKLFLKVEAEGFEIEVLKGLGGVRPRVVVVDITPERGGESPAFEVEEILKIAGYSTFKKTERCLFAKI